MKLTIESINDELHGPCFHFYGDADSKGLHSFSGIEDSLETAFTAAKECIRTELNYWPIPVVADSNAPKNGALITLEQFREAAKQIGYE